MKVCGHLHVPAALPWTIIHSIYRREAGECQSRSGRSEQDKKNSFPFPCIERRHLSLPARAPTHDRWLLYSYGEKLSHNKFRNLTLC